MSNPSTPMPKTIGLGADLHAYLVAHGTPPDDVLTRLAADTLAMGRVGRMQIAPEQGALLTLLAKLLDARFIVEVGTFTGYSSVCLARGLSAGGRLLCCDVSEEYTRRARQAWEEAGLTDRVELRIGPAVDTLRSLPDSTVIDMAFIDADKIGYPVYYEEILSRLRPGGLVALDNVLWGGQVLDPTDTTDDTKALRAINDAIVADDRVDVVMLPIADGLTLARKR